MNEPDSYVKRKEASIIKELDSLHAHAMRSEHQIISFRAWTVAIIIPTLGWVLQAKQSYTEPPRSLALLGVATLASFLCLELRQRAAMTLAIIEINSIKYLFMIEDQQCYEERLRAYVLHPKPLSKSDIIKHMIRSLAFIQVYFWYLFWAGILSIVIRFVWT